MLYTLENARANVRNRDGKRVFYLGEKDQLTFEARQWLRREGIGLLDARQAKPPRYRLPGGGWLEEKPEHMTHLYGDVLVMKSHPRIRFRGAVDMLEAEIMLCQLKGAWVEQLQEILTLSRRLIRCDVLGEPVGDFSLDGLTEQEQRSHSHCPQEYYGQPHFMPEHGDGDVILALNRARCTARQAELAAVDAFSDREGLPNRPDILQALNRISSMLYILMIREKAKQ